VLYDYANGNDLPLFIQNQP
jgi:hypothetical protein